MKTKNTFAKISAALLAVGTLIISFGASSKKPTGASSVYDFKLKTLEGEEITLEKYKGKKMLLVNVASHCGYTPQYADLEKLYEQHGDKLVVIGFPANNFLGQEPGDAQEIREFCTKNYGVKFPMMEKISVKGKDMNPLYQYLSSKKENGVCDDAPSWNFCKYLIDENGKVIKFFSSKVNPMSEEIISLL